MCNILGNCIGLMTRRFVGWLVVLRINAALAIFQPYRDMETVLR